MADETGYVLGQRSADRFKQWDSEGPEPTRRRPGGGGGGPVWGLVRCTSATAAGGSGVPATLYPGTRVTGDATSATPADAGTVWLTVLGPAGTPLVPVVGNVYACLMGGWVDGGSGDMRPRAIGSIYPFATQTVAGIVSTGTQTFGGNKTFSGNVSVNGNASVTGTGAFTTNVTVGGNLTGSGNATFAGGTGTFQGVHATAGSNFDTTIQVGGAGTSPGLFAGSTGVTTAAGGLTVIDAFTTFGPLLRVFPAGAFLAFPRTTAVGEVYIAKQGGGAAGDGDLHVAGNLIVTGTGTVGGLAFVAAAGAVAGGILYHDGTIWQVLAPPSSAATYTLKMTVAVGGSKTLAWV